MITKKKKKKKKRPRDRIFTQPSKYFSILQDIAIGLYITLFIHTPPVRAPTLYEPGDYCDSLDRLLEYRTIVIVLSSTTIHLSYYLTR